MVDIMFLGLKKSFNFYLTIPFNENFFKLHRSLDSDYQLSVEI